MKIIHQVGKWVMTVVKFIESCKRVRRAFRFGHE